MFKKYFFPAIALSVFASSAHAAGDVANEALLEQVSAACLKAASVVMEDPQVALQPQITDSYAVMGVATSMSGASPKMTSSICVFDKKTKTVELSAVMDVAAVPLGEGVSMATKPVTIEAPKATETVTPAIQDAGEKTAAGDAAAAAAKAAVENAEADVTGAIGQTDPGAAVDAATGTVEDVKKEAETTTDAVTDAAKGAELMDAAKTKLKQKAHDAAEKELGSKIDDLLKKMK